jgi:hypothetical protein
MDALAGNLRPEEAGTIFLVAKFKPAGSKKPKAAQSKRGFIPCLIFLVVGFVLLSLLFYAVMRSG